MSKNNSKNKVTLHDLLEYVRGFYADTAAERLTGKTNVEVNWTEGNIGKIDEIKKKSVNLRGENREGQ